MSDQVIDANLNAKVVAKMAKEEGIFCWNCQRCVTSTDNLMSANLKMKFLVSSQYYFKNRAASSSSTLNPNN